MSFSILDVNHDRARRVSTIVGTARLEEIASEFQTDLKWVTSRLTTALMQAVLYGTHREDEPFQIHSSRSLLEKFMDIVLGTVPHEKTLPSAGPNKEARRRLGWLKLAVQDTYELVLAGQR